MKMNIRERQSVSDFLKEFELMQTVKSVFFLF